MNTNSYSANNLDPKVENLKVFLKKMRNYGMRQIDYEIFLSLISIERTFLFKNSSFE